MNINYVIIKWIWLASLFHQYHLWCIGNKHKRVNRNIIQQGREMHICVNELDHYCFHDANIKWKHFPRYWPFVRGIHRSPGNSPHNGQWCGALMFPLICAWTSGWINNRDTGDLRRHRSHYDFTVMQIMAYLSGGAVFIWTNAGLLLIGP